MSAIGLRTENITMVFLMEKESNTPVEDEFIGVDVEEEEDELAPAEIKIDPIEEEKKRIETDIIELIDKGKVDVLVEKYQNLTKLLSEEIKLKEEYLNTAQLVQAEFENYKKRVYKDQEYANYRNKASILQKFLVIYEDIERTYSKTSIDSDLKTTIDALKLIFRNMQETLADLGVKIIDPLDEIYNPKFHEALYVKEDDKIEENKIIEVVSKGFIVDNNVLKPARVVISKKPKKIEDGNSQK